MMGPWERGAEAAEAAPRAGGRGAEPPRQGVQDRGEGGLGPAGAAPPRPQGGGSGLVGWASCWPLGAALESGLGVLVSGGAEEEEESSETPRPPLSPTCNPQHLLLEEMDEMGNWPPE